MEQLLANREAFIAMQGFGSVFWRNEKLIFIIDRQLQVVIVATHADGF